MREERFGGWIETYTGKKFYPFDPRVEDIVVEDMIHAVCHLCRFGGHSRQFYSVGQHLLLVHQYLKDRDEAPLVRLYGLTHDFAEAYLADLPGPIKRMMAEYQELERRLSLMIWESFRVGPLDEKIVSTVKEADKLILRHEANVLGVNKNNWAQNVPLNYPIREERPSEVKERLRNTFHALMEEVRSARNPK